MTNVLILGAGVMGSAFGILLADASHHVCIMEIHQRFQLRYGHDVYQEYLSQ